MALRFLCPSARLQSFSRLARQWERVRASALVAQHHGAGLLAHLPAPALVGQQRAHLLPQLGGIGHHGGATLGHQLAGDVAEVEIGGAAQARFAQRCRLQQVVATTLTRLPPTKATSAAASISGSSPMVSPK